MYIKICHSIYLWMSLYTSLSWSSYCKTKRIGIVSLSEIYSAFSHKHINHKKTCKEGMNLRDRVFLSNFSIPLSGFLMVHSLHLLNICGKLVICQTLCYTYLYSKIILLPKRRHSLWDWIPAGHEPQAHDNQKYFETVTWWALCDPIPAKILSEKSVLLGNVAPSGTSLWWEQMATGLLTSVSTVPVRVENGVFAQFSAQLAYYSTGSKLAPNPSCSRKASYILKMRKGRTQKGKKHFLN